MPKTKTRITRTTDLATISALLREGLTTQQVATQMGLTYNQVKGRIERYQLRRALPPRQHNRSPFTPKESDLIQAHLPHWIEDQRLTAEKIARRIEILTEKRIAKQNVLLRIKKLPQSTQQIFAKNTRERRKQYLALIAKRRSIRAQRKQAHARGTPTSPYAGHPPDVRSEAK